MLSFETINPDRTFRNNDPPDDGAKVGLPPGQSGPAMVDDEFLGLRAVLAPPPGIDRSITILRFAEDGSLTGAAIPNWRQSFCTFSDRL
jgi:hypothetical protein